ncbi:hypothetical protein [Nonomuraea candida]|uniref:hypothetical protein n=1 Tax=Nonomuraea candida TaxID=359159 RepID=UPI0005BC97A7|nr:hypothetical protein [Nonomuraea candida]
MAKNKRLAAFLRWLPFIIIVVELVLLYTGVISFAQAAILIIILELCLIGVVIGELAALRIAFRRARKGGATRPQALLVAIDACLPPPLAFVVKQELQVFLVLPALLRRDRHDEGFTPVSCSGITRRISLGLLALAVAGVLLALLIGDPAWLRWVLLGLSIYLVFYALGLWTLYTTYRHLVGMDQLRVRHGATIDIALPLERLSDAAREDHIARAGQVVEEEDAFAVSMFGRTNVSVTFDEPVRVEPFGREPVEVRRVWFFADEPDACVALITGAATRLDPRTP